MNSKIITLIILSLLFSCQKEQSNDTQQIEQKSKNQFEQKLGNYFFDFDNIQYYYIDISEEDAMLLMDNPKLSALEKLKSDIILGHKPEKIHPINFLNKMKKIGFKEITIPANQFEEINNIFREKTAQDSYSAACIPIYRDILVFKKANKVIGLAKICFACKLFQIVGTEANQDNFGQGNDLENLNILLNSIR